MSKIEYKGLTANVWYDDRDPSNKGWYAEYRDASGATYSDSMKAWEEEMPRRENSENKAHAIALRALKAEHSRSNQKSAHHATKALTDHAGMKAAYHVYAPDGFESAHRSLEAAEQAARRGAKNRRMEYRVYLTSPSGFTGGEHGTLTYTAAPPKRR